MLSGDGVSNSCASEDKWQPDWARTLEAGCQNLRRITLGGHGAVKGAVCLVGVRGGLQCKTPHAPSLHAPTTAAALHAAIAAKRVLLFESVPPRWQVQVVVSSVGAVRVGSLHVGGVAVDDTAASLACIPLLGEFAAGGLWPRYETRAVVLCARVLGVAGI